MGHAVLDRRRRCRASVYRRDQRIPGLARDMLRSFRGGGHAGQARKADPPGLAIVRRFRDRDVGPKLLSRATAQAVSGVRPDPHRSSRLNLEILTNLLATTTIPSIRVALVLGFGFLGLLLFYNEMIVFSFGPNGSGENASQFTTALVFSRLSAAVLAGGQLGLGDVVLPSAVIARSANLVAALAPR